MLTRVAVWWSSIALLLASATGMVVAHPLGNFTINHLAVVAPERNTLKVRYVLDIAEIPTFQIMRETSRESWGAAQLDAWGLSEIPAVTAGLRIDLDGIRVQLRPVAHHERLRRGAGGLPILYWTCDFIAPLSIGKHHIVVTDGVYAGRRIGWKDVIVAPPETEPTHELLIYPNALIGSPRRVHGLSFDLNTNATARSIVATAGEQPDTSGSNSIVRSNTLSEMFSNGNRTPLFILLTILVAFGLGALHAIEPGHGKALLAFTLVGSRATVKQAAILAASLTFAHTAGVLVLGIALFFATGFVSESIYPWITLLSGIAVAVIGARNLSRYFGARPIHAHGGGGIHTHAFTQEHHHGDALTGHSHAIPGTGPIDFRSAVVAAMSGGVAPCPAAIVVMLAALRLHQMGYGILLIVIFSLGLASVLTSLGIAIVHGSALISRSGKFDRLVATGPLLSAMLISLVGAIMIGQGFVAQGVQAPVWILAMLVVLAIAGYGLTPQHSHAHSVKEHAV